MKECLSIEARELRLVCLSVYFYCVYLPVNFGGHGASEGAEVLQMNAGFNPVVDQRHRVIFGDLGGFSTSE